MELCSKQKDKPEYVLYFRFFKVATFAHSQHSLDQIHEVVTWNGFQLTCVPCQEFICGISCLLNVFRTISCVVQRQGWCTTLYGEQAYSTTVLIHIMARTTQLSKEKQQSIIILRPEGHSIRKISRTLNVSSSAVQ